MSLIVDVYNKVRTILTITTSNLDAKVSSRTSTAVWTDALAAQISTRVDAAISSRTSTAVWTDALAAKISSNVDAKVSEVSPVKNRFSGTANPTTAASSTWQTFSSAVSTSKCLVSIDPYFYAPTTDMNAMMMHSVSWNLASSGLQIVMNATAMISGTMNFYVRYQVIEFK